MERSPDDCVVALDVDGFAEAVVDVRVLADEGILRLPVLAVVAEGVGDAEVGIDGVRVRGTCEEGGAGDGEGEAELVAVTDVLGLDQRVVLPVRPGDVPVDVDGTAGRWSM